MTKLPKIKPITAPLKAIQVCNAGDWPEDHGGNFTPDRRQANMAFSDWLDKQGDSLPLPTSFQDWLDQNQDSIIQ